MSKEDVELYFYKLLRGNLSISEFEKWVYDIDEDLINKYFGSGFYLELVGINYRNKHVINELEKLVLGKVPFGRFEEIKIKAILQSVIKGNGNLIELTEELYDLYCDGYSFLRYLGLSYVYHGIPREHDTYIFDEESRINLKNEAQRILSFLNLGKIVISGEYEYDDYREEIEKVEFHSLEKMYVKPKSGIIQKLFDKIRRTIR